MKLRAVTVALLLGVTSLALISGCSRERIDWKSAEAADTQEGYDHFLERHPDSQLATQARARLTQLAEDKDWQRAIAADTADAYRSFLAQHATGKWAEEARIRMENFTLDSNTAPPGTPPETAPASAATRTAATTPAQKNTATRSDAPGDPAAPREPASSAHTPPPPGPPSKPAPVAPARPAGSAAPADESSGYGIQLGAFSSQAAALTEWKRIQLKFDPQLHGLFAHAVPVTVTSGTLFRLQSPVADEAKARDICTELTKLAQPCVVVLPKGH